MPPPPHVLAGQYGEADGILKTPDHVRQGRGKISSSVHRTGAAMRVQGVNPWAIRRAMRPLQWTKNAVVFAALVFDGKLFEAGPLLHSLLAALAFCGVSSAVYLLNDLKDVDADRLHPKKRLRPIAAGLVTPDQAAVTAALLLALALAGGFVDGLKHGTAHDEATGLKA